MKIFHIVVLLCLTHYTEGSACDFGDDGSSKSLLASKRTGITVFTRSKLLHVKLLSACVNPAYSLGIRIYKNVTPQGLYRIMASARGLQSNSTECRQAQVLSSTSAERHVCLIICEF